MKSGEKVKLARNAIIQLDIPAVKKE